MNMNKKLVKLSACFLTGAITLTGTSFAAGASSVSELPSAGIEAALNDCYTASADVSIKEYLAPKVQTPAQTSKLAVAKVNDYVNIRKSAKEDAKSLGKLYKGGVGTVVESKNGWTKIKSGSVTGYVKDSYLYLGDAAEKAAAKVGKKVATVNTTTLKVRDKASEKAEVLDLAPIGEQMSVTKQAKGWVGVKFNGKTGYVSEEFVKLKTVYKKAESAEEEKARLEAEEAKKQAEAERAAAAQQTSDSSSSVSRSNSSSNTGSSNRRSTNSSNRSSGSKSSGSGNSGSSYKAPGSASGQAVVNYAAQFVGGPYKWGGTSLTGGADCSGFVLAVYAKFGVSLPHSSGAMRSVGRGVSYSEVQPGDIICYSGHVGIYAGGGRIVNALNSRSGITYTSATYKSILAVRRIF